MRFLHGDCGRGYQRRKCLRTNVLHYKETKEAASTKMKTKSLLGGFVQRARDLGAIEAKVIRADSVVTAP